jgi:hypothetical protein
MVESEYNPLRAEVAVPLHFLWKVEVVQIGLWMVVQVDF